MAALVQTLPPQTATVTMLGRPSSSGGYPSAGSQGQMRNHHQPSRYNNMSTGYRGIPSSGPIAPYAFTSTPNLANTNAGINPRHFALNSGRSISSPKVPPVGTSPSSQPISANGLPHVDAGNRPLSLGLPAIPSTGPLLGPTPQSTAPKPSPDRYRRNQRRPDAESSPNRTAAGTAFPSGSGMAAVGSLYNHPSQSNSTPTLSSQQSHRNSTYGGGARAMSSSADDLQLGRNQPPELAARYRRRSFGSIDTAGLNHSTDSQDAASPHPNAFLSQQPVPPSNTQLQRPAHHRHTSSSDSGISSKSAHSSRPASVSLFLVPSHSFLTVF